MTSEFSHSTNVALLVLFALMQAGCANLQVTMISDQDELARLAIEDKDAEVRRTAVAKLCDQTLLAKVACCAREWDAKQTAVAKLTDQTLLAKIANDNQSVVSVAAVAKLTDQALLAEIVLGNMVANSGVRRMAISRLTDQAILTKIALNRSSDYYDLLAAIENLTNQVLLADVALKTDGGAKRKAVIAKLTDQKLLADVALKLVFLGRYGVEDSLAAVAKLTDQSMLTRVAMEATKVSWDTEVLAGIAAVKRITDQVLLIEIAGKAEEWEVRRTAFGKLDTVHLAEVEQTQDRALVLAAQIRLQKTTWDKAFASEGFQGRGLGDLLGAVALVDTPQPANETVVVACHAYIRRGDASRIPELRNLLLRFGDRPLAEDYLNCGRDELATAGTEWARAHGMNVGAGTGSHRVTWGSNR